MRQNALRRFLCSSVCSALLGSAAAVAQQGAASQLSLWQLLEQVTPGQSARMVLPELPPADHVVSAEHYVVGPGDVLLLQIVAPVVQEHVLVVSPDGELLLPRIGALSVQGRTLAWVRSEVERRVRERNPKAEAVVLLQKARTVLVTVRGYVRFPGVYALPATVRVSTAVRLAVLGRMEQSGQKPGMASPPVASMQQLERAEYEPSAVPFLPSYCTRNILLRYADGHMAVADLERARALGDVAADPPVREGMEIVVPEPLPEYPVLSIAGAVRMPLRLAYREGDRLSLLLRLCGGLDLERAEPFVLVYLPQQPVQRVELDSAGMPLRDVVLPAGSAVVVPERPIAGARATGVATVLGAVARPGAYPIEPGRTRLRELLERAGGVLPEAVLELAYIRRQPPASLAADVRLPSEVQLYERFLYSDLRLEDTVRYALEMRLRRSRVACDFVALLRRGDERHNIVLEDGDQIVIPLQGGYVYVGGMVRVPGFVRYEPGRPVEWYIEQAGGYSSAADPKRLRILRGSSYTWLRPREAGAPQPGDEIYVPGQLDVPAWAEKQAELQLYTVLTGAVSTLTFVLATIVNLLRR